jgi:hypothetical protein
LPQGKPTCLECDKVNDKKNANGVCVFNTCLTSEKTQDTGDTNTGDEASTRVVSFGEKRGADGVSQEEEADEKFLGGTTRGGAPTLVRLLEPWAFSGALASQGESPPPRGLGDLGSLAVQSVVPAVEFESCPTLEGRPAT